MIESPGEWHVSPDGIPYPPEPWFLGGDFVVGAFLVPTEELPASVAATLPEGARPVRLGDRTLVGVAVVHYTPGGVLAYEEVLVAIPVWVRGGLQVTISQIWVTSVNSREGGRLLWGIPKEDAAIDRRVTGPRSVRTTMDVDGRTALELDARVGATLLPGRLRLPLPLPTAQRLDGRSIFSVNTVTAEVRLARAEWTFAPDGPLGWLAGARPFVGAALTRAAVVFGERVTRLPHPARRRSPRP